MHFLYIIYSEKINRYYVGETYDVHIRLENHLIKFYSKSYTKSANDWVLKLLFETENRSDAQKLEKFIKKMKSKEFIEKLILNPEILTEILQKIKI